MLKLEKKVGVWEFVSYTQYIGNIYIYELVSYCIFSIVVVPLEFRLCLLDSRSEYTDRLLSF